MGAIQDACEQWLTEVDVTYTVDDERSLIKCNLGGHNAGYKVVFDMKEERQQLLVYFLGASSVPEARRLVAAEFVARANWGLKIGNFELDLRDGEIRYKCSVDVEGGILTPRMVRMMVLAGLSTMDRYHPGLMAMSFANVDAEAAVASVENDD